jgi:restriction system protein
MIDRDFLMRFPQFVQFTQATGTQKRDVKGEEAKQDLPAPSQTPEELMDSAHRQLHNGLKKEVLDLAKTIDPYRFEQIVVDLLLAMGYGGSREEAAKVTKASGDEGIDGVINEDRLGLDVVYIQAKRWNQTVGRKEIQSFVGALDGKRARKGVFITTSDFAETARLYVETISSKVVLIDGDRLADLMIEHNIGVTRSLVYEIKRVDSDYFEEA